MHSKQLSAGLILLLAVMTASGAAAKEKVLHYFNFGGYGGTYPNAALISDAAGNLYGTTLYGGVGECQTSIYSGCGVVFELTPNPAGGWSKTVLHNFKNDGVDGFYPYSGLVFDAAGSLYGTTGYGGSGVCSSVAPTGCGTVFKLTPKPSGGWREKVLYSFAGGSDGDLPQGGLIFDRAGNLYGTTAGVVGLCTHTPFTACGTVFRLTRQQDGSWTNNVLHAFSSSGTDGFAPYGDLLIDRNNNLYGGTYWGGTFNDGIAFQLTPSESDSWIETPYSFYWGKGINGGGPGGFVLDDVGNFFGTSALGGPSFSGVVFQLSLATGTWTETPQFPFDIFTGGQPNAKLVLDHNGSLYGTNQFGGAGMATCLILGSGGLSAGCGTVFKLTPKGDGGWTQTILHSFGNGIDGQVPRAGLLRDAKGRLYGTTSSGGTMNGGVVFQITP